MKTGRQARDAPQVKQNIMHETTGRTLSISNIFQSNPKPVFFCFFYLSADLVLETETRICLPCLSVSFRYQESFANVTQTSQL